MKIIMLLPLLLFVLIANHSMAQQPREIVQKSTDAIKTDAMEMTSTLDIYNNRGDVRTRQVTTATKKFGEVSKTLLRFTAPADVAGTTMLVYDYTDRNDDMWIYMPALRKMRRIVSSEKGKNFMGSEFTNADMSMPNINDFEYKQLGEETVNGKSCFVIESKSKNEIVKNEYGVSKRISYIEKENFLTQRIDYYDLYGELNRVQTIKDYKKQPNGKYFAFYMEMENMQNGRKSVMTIDAFQQGSALTENTFAPAMLER